MKVSWPAYLETAERKVSIAEFHAGRLDSDLSAHPGKEGNLPGVSVQAHFEGSTIGVMAAADQVAQAINSGLDLGLSPAKLVTGAFGKVGSDVPGLEQWFNDPLGVNLRRLRTRMIHYAYQKSPHRLSWVVEDAETSYTGSRELSSYARDAVAYGQRLIAALPTIRRRLEQGRTIV